MRPALLIALALVTACRTLPARVDLVAVVETEHDLELRERAGGHWTAHGTLPRAARAIRFSPDGSRVAWVEDRATGMNGTIEAFERAPSGEIRPLGALQAREEQAFGLAVDDRTGTRKMGPGAMFRDLVITRDGAAHVRDGCLEVSPALAMPICGDALRPLDIRSGTVVARTNASLVIGDQHGVSARDITDVIDAQLGPDDALVVLRRSQSSGRVEDVLLVGNRAGTFQERLRAPVIVSARWAGDHVVAIRADGRIMDNLLAHAPDEFGGEAISGEAVELDERGAHPIAGLEGAKVRDLHVPR